MLREKKIEYICAQDIASKNEHNIQKKQKTNWEVGAWRKTSEE